MIFPKGTVSLIFIRFYFHTLKVKIKGPRILGKRFTLDFPDCFFGLGFLISFLPGGWDNTFLILLNRSKLPVSFPASFVHFSHSSSHF